MRRVALIYNPASGQHTLGRRAAIDKALAILREAGVEAKRLEDRRARQRQRVGRRGHEPGLRHDSCLRRRWHCS